MKQYQRGKYVKPDVNFLPTVAKTCFKVADFYILCKSQHEDLVLQVKLLGKTGKFYPENSSELLRFYQLDFVRTWCYRTQKEIYDEFENGLYWISESG